MSVIYLGLGSNLGDRAANLRGAVRALPPEVSVVVESAVYETPPWGVEDQPGFLNMALKAETRLMPEALRGHVKRIERKVGRTETYRWGPRVIDIDILLYDDRIVDTPKPGPAPSGWLWLWKARGPPRRSARSRRLRCLKPRRR